MMPEDLHALENTLRTIRPAAVHIPRDAMLFNAGRAAEASRQRLKVRAWQTASGTAMALAIFMGLHQPFAQQVPPQNAQIIQPHPDSTPVATHPHSRQQPPESFASIEDHAAPSFAVATDDTGNYLQLRRLVLAKGTQALRTPTSLSQPSANTPFVQDPDILNALPDWQRQAARQGEHS